MKYSDLHMHTIYSDGTCRPKQNVVDAAMLGLEAIAITDHDITSGFCEAKEEAEKWGIEVLTGVEISAQKYHILGYNFDINDKGLQELLKYSRHCQEEIVKKRVERIASIGVPITFSKVKGLFPESRIGKMNIVSALMMDSECRAYICNSSNKSSDEIFNLYLGKGAVGSRVGHKEEVMPGEAIDAIHKAGGIAVLAHPAKDVDDIREIDALAEIGIDGLEIQPNARNGYEVFREYAMRNGLLVTYGSDYHGARFSERPLLGKNGNLIEEFWR